MSDLLLFLKEHRHIFSVCPECGTVHRLSDLQLARKGRYALDWLDLLEKNHRTSQTKYEALEARSKELQRKAKALAERRELPKLLRKVAPSFVRQKINPTHVRTIFDPVEFVVFHGMQSEDGVRSVSLMHMGTNTRLTRSIEEAVSKGNFGWNTVKVGENGDVSHGQAARLPSPKSNGKDVKHEPDTSKL